MSETGAHRRRVTLTFDNGPTPGVTDAAVAAEITAIEHDIDALAAGVQPGVRTVSPAALLHVDPHITV